MKLARQFETEAHFVALHLLKQQILFLPLLGLQFKVSFETAILF